MHSGGFGDDVAELVMCWIAVGDVVVPPSAKMPGKTLQETQATFYFHRMYLTQQKGISFCLSA